MANSYHISLDLPPWLPSFVEEHAPLFSSREDQMRFVIALSRRNVEEESGGPFAAAIFERESGRLVAPGVNLVVNSHTSVAHAETVAFMLAQQRLQSFTLSHPDLPAMDLVASSQPCIQCFGNTWWSGAAGLVIGARGEDVESITGFHEGPLPENWIELLAHRTAPLKPVEVQRDLLRDEAVAVLELYRDSGGLIYNS
jgi:tRNA(Arg) A34 adenosine deaminase TadA